MRPLQVLNLYDCIAPGSVGGVEQRNLELARALAERGHRVTLAGWAAAASEPWPGVSIRPLRAPRILYTRRSRRSTGAAALLALDATRLDLAGHDLVDTANIPYVHLLPLAARCRRRRTPLCVTWHEYWGHYWKEYLGGPAWPAYAAVEQACARLGTVATAVSRLTAERLSRRRGEAVPVVPNGVPVDDVARAAAEAEGPGPPLIYAGRLLPEKRLDLLVRAIALLRDMGRRGPLLTVVGDGPERGRLATLARELGVGSAVAFRGRVDTARDVWRELGAARVAVQPSSREGFGLFPLEALAAGLPVVYCASGESAVGELVRDGVEGVRSEADPEALARALDGLLSPAGAERLARLARAGRRRARDLSWTAVAERVEAVYEEALRRVGRPGRGD